MSCFWTNFNLTYEICGGVGGATFWPVNSTTYAVDGPLEGEYTTYGTGVEIFADLWEDLGGDWEDTQFPRPTINWSELPVSEAWIYHSNVWGEEPVTKVIVQVEGLASGATITANHVSGEVRVFSVLETSGPFALLGLSFNDPDLTYHESVYDISVGDTVLRLHIRSSFVAF